MNAAFLVKDTILPKLVLIETTLGKIEESMEEGGLEFIRWCNVGSQKESAVPPIRFGVLRGSTSVFYGNKLVSVWAETGAEGEVTPLRTYRGRKYTITLIYNTDYATKVHENEKLKYSDRSLSAGAEKQWLTKHLQQDKDDLWELISSLIRKKLV